MKDLVLNLHVKLNPNVNFNDERILESAFSVIAFPLPNNCIGVSFENITEREKANPLELGVENFPWQINIELSL